MVWALVKKTKGDWSFVVDFTDWWSEDYRAEPCKEIQCDAAACDVHAAACIGKGCSCRMPFDSLYGYSQGGGLAALVGAHLVAKHATGFAAMLISLLSWMAQ